MSRRLYRSQRDRVFAGVCGGLGEYFDVDATLVRIAFVALLLATGVFPCLVIYIVLAIIVPLEGRPYQEPRQVVVEGVEELKGTVAELVKDIRDTFRATPETEVDREESRRRRTYLLGLVIIVIGIIILVANLGGFFWWKWAWPVILIVIGLAILVGRRGR